TGLSVVPRPASSSPVGPAVTAVTTRAAAVTVSPPGPVRTRSFGPGAAPLGTDAVSESRVAVRPGSSTVVRSPRWNAVTRSRLVPSTSSTTSPVPWRICLPVTARIVTAAALPTIPPTCSVRVSRCALAPSFASRTGKRRPSAADSVTRKVSVPSSPEMVTGVVSSPAASLTNETVTGPEMPARRVTSTWIEPVSSTCTSSAGGSSSNAKAPSLGTGAGVDGELEPPQEARSSRSVSRKRVMAGVLSARRGGHAHDRAREGDARGEAVGCPRSEAPGSGLRWEEGADARRVLIERLLDVQRRVLAVEALRGEDVGHAVRIGCQQREGDRAIRLAVLGDLPDGEADRVCPLHRERLDDGRRRIRGGIGDLDREDTGSARRTLRVATLQRHVSCPLHVEDRPRLARIRREVLRLDRVRSLGGPGERGAVHRRVRIACARSDEDRDGLGRRRRPRAPVDDRGRVDDVDRERGGARRSLAIARGDGQPAQPLGREGVARARKRA